MLEAATDGTSSVCHAPTEPQDRAPQPELLTNWQQAVWLGRGQESRLGQRVGGAGVPEAPSAATPFWLDTLAFHTFLGFKEEKGLLSPLSLQTHRVSMTSTVPHCTGSAMWPTARAPRRQLTAPNPPSGGAHGLTHTFLGWALLAGTMTAVSSVSDSWYGSCPQGGGGGWGGGVLLFEVFLKLGKEQKK